MTNQTNDRDRSDDSPSDRPIDSPSRPDDQDTSEHMDKTTQHEQGITEVFPPPTASPATPPTQEIAQHTEQHTGRLSDSPAPEGEVHPAYGIAAARELNERPEQAGPGEQSAAEGGQPGQSVQPGQPVQPAKGQPQDPARRGPRVGTAVWGLIVIAIGLGILAVAAGVAFDLGVALIVTLGAAGVILVVGSVGSSLRRR